MEILKTLVKKKAQRSTPAYAKYSFQDFGYRLAKDLGDLAHKGLYIKLAKELPRSVLQKARDFAIDYPQAKSKAKVFMWKLEELKLDKESLKKE